MICDRENSKKIQYLLTEVAFDKFNIAIDKTLLICVYKHKWIYNVIYYHKTFSGIRLFFVNRRNFPSACYLTTEFINLNTNNISFFLNNFIFSKTFLLLLAQDINVINNIIDLYYNKFYNPVMYNSLCYYYCKVNYYFTVTLY